MKFVSRQYGFDTPAAAPAKPRPAVYAKSYGFPQTPPKNPAQRFILGMKQALRPNHPIYQTVRKDATADATIGGRNMALHISGYQY